ncbi:MAG: hypothetical protein R3Y63_12360 [Eubacteriales bacterium]
MNKMTIKTGAVLITLSLCFFLTACGSDSDAPLDTTVTIEEPAPVEQEEPSGPSQEEILAKYTNDMSKFVELVDTIGDPFLRESDAELIKALGLMVTAAEKVSTFHPTEELEEIHTLYAKDTQMVAETLAEMAYHVECFTLELIEEEEAMDYLVDLSIEMTFALEGTSATEEKLLEELGLDMLFSFYGISLPVM